MDDRWTIRPIPIEDWEDGWPLPLLVPAATHHREQIAELMARYFSVETPFDFAPFSVGDISESDLVFLVNSTEILHTYPVAVGAIGLRHTTFGWMIRWFWLHPFERASDRHETARKVLEELGRQLGPIYFEAPVTAPMRALVEKMGYGENRLLS